MAGRPIHENMFHVLDWFGVLHLEELPRAVYDETECGASIHLMEPDGTWHIDPARAGDWAGLRVVAIRFHTIVEGSDAEFTTDPLYFPIDDDSLRTALDWLSGEAERAEAEADLDNPSVLGAWGDDRCRVCNKFLGMGHAALHLGLCEDCDPNLPEEE